MTSVLKRELPVNAEEEIKTDLHLKPQNAKVSSNTNTNAVENTESLKETAIEPEPKLVDKLPDSDDTPVKEAV